MTNFIEPIKAKLDEKMHEMCTLYCLIGMGKHESPRYFNYGGFSDNILTIRSTQKNLQFQIETPDGYPDPSIVNCDEFWNQFKKYRTEFLQDNYPTIELY
jgi:hypothetical protein